MNSNKTNCQKEKKPPLPKLLVFIYATKSISYSHLLKTFTCNSLITVRTLEKLYYFKRCSLIIMGYLS